MKNWGVLLSWWLVYFGTTPGANIAVIGNQVVVAGPFEGQSQCFQVGTVVYQAILAEQRRSGVPSPVRGPIDTVARCVNDTPEPVNPPQE